MWHVAKWIRNFGWSVKSRWRARRRRLPQQRPGIDPIIYTSDYDREQYFKGITCGPGALAEPKPAKNHLDDRLQAFTSAEEASARLFGLVHKLEKYRTRR